MTKKKIKKEIGLVDYVKIRSVEDDGCWIWNELKKGELPIMRWDKTRNSVRRILYKELINRNINQKVVVLNTCENQSCVNPDHLKIVTRSFINKQPYIKGRRNTLNEYLKRQQAAIKQGRSKINLSIAREIRMFRYDFSIQQLAKKYQLDESQIRNILRNKCWRELAPNASVFSMKLAA